LKSLFLSVLPRENKTLIKALRDLLFTQRLRFKKVGNTDFPNWETNKAQDLFDVIMGQSPNSRFYNVDGIGYPLVQGNADIQNRITCPRNYTSEITKECKIGDLILTVRAPVGTIARSVQNACIGRGVCAIRKRENTDVSLDFFYQYLIYFENKWSSVEQGSTFTSVTGNEIKELSLPNPTFEEQKCIAALLTLIDKKIKVERENLSFYELQKSKLLYELFI
jgi:type I restriction enzyme S subunit